MILDRFRRRSQDGIIAALYGAIVAQARAMPFYADYGVPDTVEGRFDLIVLHLVLALHRLSRDAAGRQCGQGLFDAFCRDMEANLREMGVGDLAVPRRMQQFGEAFYGRQSVYLAALAAADPQDLERALARNIFQDVGTDQGPARLARYARAAMAALDAQEESALMRGEVAFPKPEATTHARSQSA